MILPGIASAETITISRTASDPRARCEGHLASWAARGH